MDRQIKKKLRQICIANLVARIKWRQLMFLQTADIYMYLSRTILTCYITFTLHVYGQIFILGGSEKMVVVTVFQLL